MVTRWIHIGIDIVDPWVLPIYGAVNDAIKAKRVAPLPNETHELGLHISTRLGILPIVALRINSEVKQIYKVVEDHNDVHVFAKNRSGYVFQMPKKYKDLVYCLLADIDSLLFELNSVCELMINFFESLYSHVGIALKEGEAGLKIKRLVESEGHDSRWFQALKSRRNFFTHEGAPWFAIDVSHGPQAYDLLIMKGNIKSFENSSKFIKLSELGTIVEGFLSAKHAIQRHLIELFQQVYL